MPEHKQTKRAMTIHLSSTASYTRAQRDQSFAGVPDQTVYQETYSQAVANKQLQTQRCVASIADKRRAYMITDVVKKIPTQRIEQLREEANVANAEQTARMLETQSAQDAQAEEQMRAEPSVAMATLHNTLDAQPKHTLKQGIVKSFFQAGGVEGPFPGSRSEQGMVAAGAYWQGNRPGKYMTMSAPGHYMPDGRKYKPSYM